MTQITRAFSRACLAFVVTLFVSPVIAQIWIEQGPGSILAGQSQGISDNPVSGGIQGIALVPGDPNTIYLAAVNGGVWKTTNGTASDLSWTPLTDKSLPSLSTASIALSPLNSNVIYVGTGSVSAFGRRGSPGFGVAKSVDGGATWTVLAGATFAARAIVSIVPTTLSLGNVVLASTLFDRGGVYRSTDGGVSFTRLSGVPGTGLPDAGVSQVIADPSNPNVFYAGVPSFHLNNGVPGVYRSVDGGQTWALVNTGLFVGASAQRILLAIHNSTGTNAVYAAILTSGSGGLSGVFRSVNQGANWSPIGLPAVTPFPGNQGSIHGAFVAHPSNPNVAFISGDRQNSPFPNALGCSNFTGSTFRGDASTGIWTSVDCDGAHGTSPHADARAMAFDSTGTMLLGNDGGIYRLIDVDDSLNVRNWRSLNGNVRPTEMHTVAYDPVSRVAFGGTQDVGTPIQLAPGSFTWTDFIQGDGGVVAVDADTIAHPGTSFRYTSSQFLQSFNRSTWNAGNGFLGFSFVSLNVTSGPGTGQNLRQFDPNIQFYNPYVLNRVDASRLLLGTSNIYESLNRGDSLANLGAVGAFVTSLSYGSRLSGEPRPDAFYVGATNGIYYRANVAAPVVRLASYPGLGVRVLVMDPQDYRRVYAADRNSQVFASFDEGATWTNITANLLSLTSSVRSIEIYSPGTNTLRNGVLLVGTDGGVYGMRRPGAAGTSWVPLGPNLPNNSVLDLRYSYTSDVLIAAVLGRGAWTLSGYFQSGAPVTLSPSLRAPAFLPPSLPQLPPEIAP